MTTAEPLTVGLASNATSFTAFSIVLFNISPTLFAGTLALGAGTWMTRRAGKELISINDAEAKTQNAYRNGIVDANSNAQNIALWGAGRSRNKPA